MGDRNTNDDANEAMLAAAAAALPDEFVTQIAKMRLARPEAIADDAMFRHIPRTPLTEAVDWLWCAIADAREPSLTTMTAEAGTTPAAFLDAANRLGYGPLFD